MSKTHRQFRDREDAGKQLAAALQDIEVTDAIVLALPRGGLPVAAEIALALKAPLGLVMVRKIGVPGQPELALAAVVDGGNPEVVVNEEIAAALGITEKQLERLSKPELEEIERRKARYQHINPEHDVTNRKVILVDDGIATGATMFAAIKALERKSVEEITVAVPVAPRDTIRKLKAKNLRVVCLEVPEPFYSVGNYYREFRQLDDEDVLSFLEQVNAKD